MSAHAIDAEIDANYDFFRRNLASFMPDQAYRYALIRHRTIVGFFDEVGEAGAAANASFDDGLYSIQQVMDEPIDLGFFSHVGS